jgi:hypothetical protein
MRLFNNDGTFNEHLMRTLIMESIVSRMDYSSPKWIIPTGTHLNMTPGGVNILEYKGPRPRIVKL